MNDATITALNAGPTALIAALCDELQLESTINSLVSWHPSYWKTSPGTQIKAMIINILCARAPLYRVEEFYDDLDVEILFGEGRQASDFNDDVLGRTLDVLHEAESWRVHSTWSLSVLHKLGLPLDVLHNDTTSIVMSGAYEQAPAEGLQVTYGYSKDKRFDLKQILLGLGVTPQRLPVFARVEDGNLQDKTWNFAFIDRMRSLLTQEEWSSLTYVADSALVTPDNLARLRENGGVAFITRLPDTYALATELRLAAVSEAQWEEAGTLGSSDKNASVYRTQSFIRDFYGQPTRFVVVHSSHLQTKEEQTLMRKLENEKQEIAKQVQALSSQDFSCEKDAENALKTFSKVQKRWKWHEVTFIIEPETYTLPREKRGRPKTGSVPEQGIRYRIIATPAAPREELIVEHRSTLGVFILLSSHVEESEWSSLRLLQTYKGQDAAETRFRLLKDPAILDAVYLKTPSRIEALGIVFVMALMVYGVLEWRVREQMKQEKEPLVLPGKRKSFKPTAEMLLAMLKTFMVVVIRYADGQKVRQLDAGMDERKARVVRLAGYDPQIYITPPRE